MKRVIQVVLDEDTAEFLALARADGNPKAISAFINSLLRQERFRQGYPAASLPSISSRPQCNPEEDVMLWRSGLLPLQRKPAR